jgi:hypothetical protein
MKKKKFVANVLRNQYPLQFPVQHLQSAPQASSTFTPMSAIQSPFSVGPRDNKAAVANFNRLPHDYPLTEPSSSFVSNCDLITPISYGSGQLPVTQSWVSEPVQNRKNKRNKDKNNKAGKKNSNVDMRKNTNTRKKDRHPQLTPEEQHKKNKAKAKAVKKNIKKKKQQMQQQKKKKLQEQVEQKLQEQEQEQTFQQQKNAETYQKFLNSLSTLHSTKKTETRNNPLSEDQDKAVKNSQILRNYPDMPNGYFKEVKKELQSPKGKKVTVKVESN